MGSFVVTVNYCGCAGGQAVSCQALPHAVANGPLWTRSDPSVVGHMAQGGGGGMGPGCANPLMDRVVNNLVLNWYYQYELMT